MSLDQRSRGARHEESCRWLLGPWFVFVFVSFLGCECKDEHGYQGWEIEWVSEKARPDDEARGDTLAGLTVEAADVRYFFDRLFLEPTGWTTSATPLRLSIIHRPGGRSGGSYEDCTFELSSSPLSEIEELPGEANFRMTLTLDGEEARRRCQEALDERAAHPDFQLDETWDDWVREADFPDLDERLEAKYFNYVEVESCD